MRIWCFPRLRLHRCCFSHLFVTVGLKHRYQTCQMYAVCSEQATLCLVLCVCWAPKVIRRVYFLFHVGKKQSSDLVSSKTLVSPIYYHNPNILTQNGPNRPSQCNLNLILRSFTNTKNVGSTSILAFQ